MKIYTLLFLFSISLISCSQESKRNTLKKIGQAVSADFAGKEKAIEDINALYTNYKATFDYDSLDFENRLELYADRYFSRFRTLMTAAVTMKESQLRNKLLSEQMNILSLRHKHSVEELTTMTPQEIMKKNEEGAMYFGLKDATLENLIFVDEKEALAGMKSAFTIQPLTFLKKNGRWKVDPFGDPIVQKMKEDALMRKAGQTKKEHLDQLLDAMEIPKDEIWTPLR